MSNLSSSSQPASGGTSTANTMITRVGLSDYDVWRNGFDRFEERRAAAGIRNPRVYRNVNDGNQVIIVFDVADKARAQQFFADPEVQKTMREGGGVLGPPMVNFL